jgi:tetratricopeptide (TPR) repeat protein
MPSNRSHPASPPRCRALVAALLVTLAIVLVTGCNPLEPLEPEVTADQELLAQGMDYSKQGLTDSAIAAFSLALIENPELTEAHVGLARIYQELGSGEDDQVKARLQWRKASRHYEEAAEDRPQDFDVHYNLGLMYQLLEEFRKSIRTYLHALTINPNNFDANHNLAAAYVQNRQISSALPFARRATELGAESHSAWAQLAEIYHRLDRDREAQEAYSRAAQLGDLDPMLKLGWVDALIQTQNYEAARQLLLDLTERYKGATGREEARIAAITFERMAFLNFRNGDYATALEQYNTALDHDEDHVAALNGRGACLMTSYIQGERIDRELRDQALKAWRASLRLDPRQPKIVNLVAKYQRM